MVYGFGRGRGFGRGVGRGFSFRGASPPWPYVGRGRGGLPRCGYFFGGPGILPPVDYQPPFYGQPAYPGYMPFPARMTKEEEIEYLKDQAQAIKEQLDQIDSRMKDLEND